MLYMSFEAEVAEYKLKKRTLIKDVTGSKFYIVHEAFAKCTWKPSTMLEISGNENGYVFLRFGDGEDCSRWFMVLWRASHYIKWRKDVAPDLRIPGCVRCLLHF